MRVEKEKERDDRIKIKIIGRRRARHRQQSRLEKAIERMIRFRA